MHDFASELMKLVCSLMSLHPATCSTLHIGTHIEYMVIPSGQRSGCGLWSEANWNRLLLYFLSVRNKTIKRNWMKKKKKWRQRQMRGTWIQDRPNIRELWKDSIKMADVDDRGSVGDEQEGGKDLWYWDQNACVSRLSLGSL